LAVALTVVALAACGRPRPEYSPQPDGTHLVANDRAVGVPYDRYFLLRHGDRHTVLHIESKTQLGNKIFYRWLAAEAGARSFAVDAATGGEGETEEDPFDGRISLPGLTLRWSRGSGATGWIYWPQGTTELEIYSRPWQHIDDVNPRRGGGKWLRESKFRKKN